MEFDSNFLIIIVFSFIAFSSLFLSFVLFVQVKNTSSNVLFSLMALSLGIWVGMGILRYYYYLISGTQDDFLFFTTVSNVFASCVFYFFFLFAHSFPEEKFIISRRKFIISLFIFGFGIFLTLYPGSVLISEDLIWDANGELRVMQDYNWGPSYTFYYIPMLVGFFLMGVYTLWKKYKKFPKSSIKRLQLKYVFWGSFFGGVFGLGFGLFLQLFPWLIDYFFLGRLAAFIFLVFITLAISKHHIFRIKLIAVEFFIFFIWVISFARIFFDTGLMDRLFDAAVFAVLLIAGILLIKTELQEDERKEELQKLTEKLQKANVRLKKLDDAKSEFISIASHQLRTPLTAIKGFVSLMLEGSYGKINVGVRDALGKVYASNERLIHLVEDLLSISRIESGRMKYEIEPWRMEDILAEALDVFTIRAKEKGIEIVVHTPKEPLPQIRIDGRKIREVVSNLIDNALKYTDKGNIEVNLKQRGSHIQLSVKDSGIGIPAEDMESLFEKFTRGKDVSRLHANGTGLGLYVGSNLIKAHGGEIWAESEGEGKGSTFFIELPLQGKLKIEKGYPEE